MEFISFGIKEIYRATDIYFLSIIGNIGIIISMFMLIKHIHHGELRPKDKPTDKMKS